MTERLFDAERGRGRRCRCCASCCRGSATSRRAVDRRERAHHRSRARPTAEASPAATGSPPRTRCAPTSRRSPTRASCCAIRRPGLVDFPAERDGRRVFLCWRLGRGAGRLVPRGARRVLEPEAVVSAGDRPSGGRGRGRGRRRAASRASTRPTTRSSCATPPDVDVARARCCRRPTRCSPGEPTRRGCRPPGRSPRAALRWIQSASAGRRRAAVPGAGRERRRRDERARRVRRADRGVGDRRDARVRDRAAPLDRRPAADASGRRDARTERLAGRAARGRRPRPDRPGHRHARARARHVGRARRSRAAAPRDVRRRARASISCTTALADADHVLDALPLTDADARAVRRSRVRGDAAAGPLLQRRARRHRRRAGAGRGAAQPARSPARRSTCSPTSRCRPTARCGRCRT